MDEEKSKKALEEWRKEVSKSLSETENYFTKQFSKNMSPEEFRKNYYGEFKNDLQNYTSQHAQQENFARANYDRLKAHQELLEVLQERMTPENFLLLKTGEAQLLTHKDISNRSVNVNVRTADKVLFHARIPEFDLTNRYGANWDTTKSKRKASKDMSNKFLPFIVESSTPLNIFKTLITRSKGMNRILLASIFNATLQVDIKKLRAHAKELPEMSLEKLYEEIMSKWDKYRISGWQLRMFEHWLAWIDKDSYRNENMKEFSSKDVMLFFCVMSHAGKDLNDYTHIKWQEGLKTDVLLNLPKHISLGDNGKEIVVSNEQELQSFLLYTIHIRPQFKDEDDKTPTYRIKMKGEN